ncbi:AAA family ATPase [Sphingobacteriaceae bacterium WQ 2009]|uniref:AAA family ATPase n=1 Tax=Rhinopithecimicrobium faecis TaxID=2820698 RepID=A0A8T4HIS8_9SPHI|nr:AAA family ATPase [Sphingobacteriaceae bacterium WQ 2009]
MAKYFLYNLYSGVDTFSAFPAGDEFSFDTSNFNPQFTFSKDDIIVCYSNPGLFYVLKIVDIKNNAIKVFKALEFFYDNFIAFDSGINVREITAEEYNDLLTDFLNNIINNSNTVSDSEELIKKFIRWESINIDNSSFNYNFSKDLSWILRNNKRGQFVFDLFTFLFNYDGFRKLKQYVVNNNHELNYSIKYNDISLTTIFRISKNMLSSEELILSGRVRFFETPLFNLDDKFYYLSTEWTFNKNERLDISNLMIIINELYPEFKLIFNNDFLLIPIDNNEITNVFKISNKQTTNSNTIYYGAPGTGKSYKVDQIIKDLDKQFYERVTFHPEYDNASFIGGYKPISVKDEEGKDIIKYEFVPQAFANIYKRAWQDLDNQYYLVIEEINRGNCAEIFGELFQLLDRNSGYTVAPSNELYKHLVEEFGDVNHESIAKGLKLPPNLALFATMNTSDQSLFPMDSAFKRRWEWEYVPICYDEMNEEGGENKSYNFVIDLGNGSQYSWIKFIEYINLNHIKENPNLGMDKCIGNYFVKPENGDLISLKQFINKVVFYLWNDVFKDEDNAVFDDKSSYEDFFPITTTGVTEVKELLKRIGFDLVKDNLSKVDIDQLSIAAESQEPYGE